MTNRTNFSKNIWLGENYGKWIIYQLQIDPTYYVTLENITQLCFIFYAHKKFIDISRKEKQLLLSSVSKCFEDPLKYARQCK